MPSSALALPAKFFTESTASVERNTKAMTDQGDVPFAPICANASSPQTVVFVMQVSRYDSSEKFTPCVFVMSRKLGVFLGMNGTVQTGERVVSACLRVVWLSGRVLRKRQTSSACACALLPAGKHAR